MRSLKRAAAVQYRRPVGLFWVLSCPCGKLHSVLLNNGGRENSRGGDAMKTPDNVELSPLYTDMVVTSSYLH